MRGRPLRWLAAFGNLHPFLARQRQRMMERQIMVCVLNGDLPRGRTAASGLSVLVCAPHGYDRPVLYGSHGGPFAPLSGVGPAHALGGGLYVLTLADGEVEALRVRVQGSAGHRDSDVVLVKTAIPTRWHAGAPAVDVRAPRFAWPSARSGDHFIYFVLVADVAPEGDLGPLRQAAYTWQPQWS